MSPVEKYNSIVLGIAAKLRHEALKELESIEENSGARFLLYGRVIMRLFQLHFNLAYEAAEKREENAAEYHAEQSAKEAP